VEFNEHALPIDVVGSIHVFWCFVGSEAEVH
jgi:hypothetical protein